MKKLLSAVVVLSVFTAVVSAVPAKVSAAKADPPAKVRTTGDLEGKMAIGATGIAAVPGIGIRYWTSDTTAIDGNFGFSSAKDTNQFAIGGSFNSIIKRSAYAKYMWLIGLEYMSSKLNADVTQSDINIGLGLGVEYTFQELPELSFAAFLTGLGVDMRNTSAFGQSTSETLFATDPGLGFAVRYYVK